jgi:hypothetical protein
MTMTKTKMTDARLYVGFDSTLTHRGRAFTVTVDRDDDMGAPWEEHDGHGPVSDWTTRDKRPGEMILNTEGRGRSRRYYDFAAACRQARAEGWGWLPGDLTTTRDPVSAAWTATVDRHPELTATDSDINRAISAVYAAHRATMTARQYAAGAALRDYEHLAAWCNDEWEWAGVTVKDEETGESESLWGIEDTTGGRYLREVAEELADEICARLDKAEAAEREAEAETMAAAIAASRPDLAPCYA